MTLIIPKDKKNLQVLIKHAIKEGGLNCNLNHIDVSQITDMSSLFAEISEFNGDISQWNVSKVNDMNYMFDNSQFNGNISNWDVSNVKTMDCMFQQSKFNGDISNWDVSKVESMVQMFFKSTFDHDISKWNTQNLININHIFRASQFSGDVSNWDIRNVEYLLNAFSDANCPIPYWNQQATQRQRVIMYNKYKLQQKLNIEIKSSSNESIRSKI